jgi:hypothetical protein
MFHLNCLIFLGLLLPRCFGVPLPDDKALDCAVRSAAYEYASELQGHTLPDFFDALALHDYCGINPPLADDIIRHYDVPEVVGPSFYADAKYGKDSNPGTLSEPFQSLPRSVLACQATGGNPCNVFLSDSAPYILTSPLVLGSINNGLTIRAMEGQSPVITSAFPVESWSPLKIDSENNIWRTTLNTSAPLPRALLVGGRRLPRARYPNAIDWETDLVPVGYTNATSWAPSRPYNPATPVLQPDATRPFDVFFPNWTWAQGGVANDFFDPPEGYWISPSPTGGVTFAVPSGFNYSTSRFSPRASLWNVSAGGGAVVKVFHGEYWGSWAFEIESFDAELGTVVFGKGGYQEARGSKVGGALHFENIREELDSPSEWFADLENGTLDLFWNATSGTPPPPGVVSAASLENLISIIGTPSSPASNISFFGITFTGTQPTFLSQKFVAISSGDWSFSNIAALFFNGSRNISVIGCTFTGLGGNALLLRGWNRDALILNSSFDRCGDSGIVSAGYTNLANLSSLDVPVGTQIIGCKFSNLGIDVKQSGGVYSALSANMTIESNVFFSLPRAAININDGAHGGHLISKNVFAQTVLQSADHGSLNTWDREVYLQTYDTNARVPLVSRIERNFFINDGYGIHSLDHDDGSNGYLDTFNVLAFSGFKNYLGFNRTWQSNLIIRPDYLSKPPSVPSTSPDGVPLPYFFYFPACVRSVGQADWGTLADVHVNNTCVMNSTSVYIYGKCNPADPSEAGDVPRSFDNTFFVRGGSIEISCGGKTLSLSEAQSVGYELNSQEFDSTSLTPDDIVSMIQKVLMDN